MISNQGGKIISIRNNSSTIHALNGTKSDVEKLIQQMQYENNPETITRKSKVVLSNILYDTNRNVSVKSKNERLKYFVRTLINIMS